MNLQPPTLVAVFCIKGVTKVSEVKIDQKINQNVIIMVVCFALVGSVEYFNLSCVLWGVGFVVLVLSVVSVIQCLFAYTKDYQSRKYKQIGDKNE